jgi:hypothetical protein
LPEGYRYENGKLVFAGPPAAVDPTTAASGPPPPDGMKAGTSSLAPWVSENDLPTINGYTDAPSLNIPSVYMQRIFPRSIQNPPGAGEWRVLSASVPPEMGSVSVNPDGTISGKPNPAAWVDGATFMVDIVVGNDQGTNVIQWPFSVRNR